MEQSYLYRELKMAAVLLVLTVLLTSGNALDVDVTDFSEKSSVPAAFREGVSVIFYFSLTLHSDTDITRRVGNVDLQYCTSGVDVRTVGRGNEGFCTPAALTTTISAMSGFRAGVGVSGTGSVFVTVHGGGNCANTLFLCVYYVYGFGAETDDLNNWRCIDISRRVSCDTALTITNFSGIRSPLVRVRDYPSQPIFLTLTNTGTLGQGGDITPVASPYSNFAFNVYYSSATGSLTQIGAAMKPSFAAAELRQGLLGGASLTLTGTLDIHTISDADCTYIKDICIEVDADTVNGASFLLATAGVQCVTPDITCSPDPEPQALTITAGGPIISGTSTTITISMNVVNANTGDNDVIRAATGSDTNYRLAFELSDVDLGSGALGYLSLGQTAPKDFTGTGTELTDGLAASATTAWTGIVADIVLSDAVCPDVTYLCAILYRGSTRDYEDATAVGDSVDLSPNTTCHQLATDQKVCRADVDMVNIEDVNTPGAVFRAGVATIFSFKLTLRSNIDIRPITTGANTNFDVTYRLADRDLRATDGVDGISHIAAALMTTVAPQGGLTADNDMIITGTEPVTVTTADCTDVLFFCAHTSANGGHTDSDTSNNWKCLDIASRIACDTALVISNFAGIRNPLVRGRVYAGQPISLTLTNTGTAGQGGDITPVASPYSNFAFNVYYSSATGSPTQVGAVMKPRFAAAELRQGLLGGASLTLTGTLDMDSISDADCASIKDICIEVCADTVNGASFLLSAADAQDRQCVTPQITCWPDPAPRALAVSAGFPFTSGGPLTITLDFNILEQRNGDNDEIYAATAPETNFNVKIFFSDVDVELGLSDTLNLERYYVTPPGTEYSSALTKGGKISITGATASLLLTDEDCLNTYFLCLELLQGSSKEYIDASGISDPQNLDNYQCVGVALAKRCRSVDAVDGGWSGWTVLGGCSAVCGGGSLSETRECNAPAPAGSGAECTLLNGSTGLTETRSQICNADTCPNDGGYGEWGAFGPCSVTCGEKGTITRSRECDSPEPGQGGKNCSRLGEKTETVVCDVSSVPCPYGSDVNLTVPIVVGCCTLLALALIVAGILDCLRRRKARTNPPVPSVADPTALANMDRPDSTYYSSPRSDQPYLEPVVADSRSRARPNPAFDLADERSHHMYP